MQCHPTVFGHNYILLILVNALAWNSRSLRWPFIERFVIEQWNNLNSEGNLIQYLLIFFSKNKSSRWLTCCLCFCLPLFRTDFTESHCPLYLQLFKRIKNRDQIQVRRRHFQLLQIDLNCKRSVIRTIMIISQLLWSQINHLGRLYSNAQIPRFTNISFHF